MYLFLYVNVFCAYSKVYPITHITTHNATIIPGKNATLLAAFPDFATTAITPA